MFLQSDYFNKQAASENTIGYKILRKGQIIFSPQNLWMGNINYNSNFEIGIVSPSYKIYQINKKFNPYFIGVLLKEPNSYCFMGICYTLVTFRVLLATKDFDGYSWKSAD